MSTTQVKNPILTLIKYNLKFVYKQLIVFYIIILLLAIIACLTDVENPSFWVRFLHEFANGATFGFSLGMFINASMRVWAKYRYSIYGDESYLIHTLPLRRTTIWAAQFLSSILVLLISGVLFLICIFIVAPISDFIAAYGDRDINFWVMAAIFCISVFCQFVFIMQTGLTGITLGHRHNNGQIAWSVTYGIGIYILSGIVMIGSTMLLGLFDSSLHDMLFNGIFRDASDLVKVFAIIDVLYLGFITVSYLVNRGILKRGVDVN